MTRRAWCRMSGGGILGCRMLRILQAMQAGHRTGPTLVDALGISRGGASESLRRLQAGGYIRQDRPRTYERRRGCAPARWSLTRRARRHLGMLEYHGMAAEPPHVGWRQLDILDSMDGAGPITADALAEDIGCSSRLVREALRRMKGRGLVRLYRAQSWGPRAAALWVISSLGREVLRMEVASGRCPGVDDSGLGGPVEGVPHGSQRLEGAGVVRPGPGVRAAGCRAGSPGPITTEESHTTEERS